MHLSPRQFVNRQSGEVRTRLQKVDRRSDRPAETALHHLDDRIGRIELEIVRRRDADASEMRLDLARKRTHRTVTHERTVAREPLENLVRVLAVDRFCLAVYEHDGLAQQRMALEVVAIGQSIAAND